MKSNKKRSNIREGGTPLMNCSGQRLRAIALCLLLCFGGLGTVWGNVLQNVRLSIKRQNTPIMQVLNQIADKTGYSVMVRDNDIDVNAKVNVNKENATVSEILDQLFSGSNVKYKVENKTISIYRPTAVAQTHQGGKGQQRVTGVVLDAAGEPIIGANVMEKGNRQNGAITDLDGKFTLNVAPNAVLSVSYIGCKTQEVSVKGKTSFTIRLTEDSEVLDEVVVVGYGTQKKVNLTGSVSQVTADDISSRPVQNITQALQGLMPGMDFSTGSEGGKLNQTQSITIRGAGTIGSGSTATPLVLIDGVEGNMNLLNPQDIETISVLKDAASASIYGSRAAFGVILVTTKQGSKGKPTVNYTNNFRFNSPVLQPEMMDSYTFVNYFNTARINASQAALFSQATIDRIVARNNGEIGLVVPASTADGGKFSYNEANANTDWYKVYYKDWVLSQDHTVSLRGGNDRLSYYLSGNFMDQEGLMRYADDKYKRYTLNATFKAKVNKHVSVNYNAKWIRTDYEEPSFLNMGGLAYHEILRRWPLHPAYDPNGYFAENSRLNQMTQGGRHNQQADRTLNQLTIDITPLEGWTIHLMGNVSTSTSFDHTDILPVYSYDAYGDPYLISISESYAAGASRVSESSSKTNYYSTNLYTDYTHQWGDHYFKGLVGFNAELNKSRSLSGRRDGIIVPDVPTLNTSDSEDLATGGYNHWAVAGFFGRLNYNYKERYLVEFNGRYDGSSRFLRNQRWRFFPSFSAGWNMAREKFWAPLTNIVNMWKFKVSYGQLGNQNTSSLYPFYQTMPLTIGTGTWLLNGEKTNTANIPALVSATMTWEKVRLLNVGIDFGMFRNRLTGTFEWFWRKTLDMVGPAPQLPGILGIAVPKTNNADMQSVGFDFDIAWRDQIGDVKYGVKFNLSDSQQKILRYPNSTNSLGDWYVGRMNGEIWGYTTIGIAKTQEEMDQHLASLPNGGQNKLGGKWQAGDIMYADINGDGMVSAGASTLADPGDRKIIGNSTPRFKFGLTLNASWKGLDMSVLLQGVAKRDYMPGNGSGGAMFWGVVNNLWQSVALKQHGDYWRADDDPLGGNPNAYYPRPDISTSKNQLPQTRYLQNAAYIRLKNVQVGYTLPKHLLSRIGVTNLRVYFSGDNLLTGTKLADMFDPETLTGGWGAGKTYPLSKVLSFGVNISM